MIRKFVIGAIAVFALFGTLLYLGYFEVRSEASPQPPAAELETSFEVSAVSWALFDVDSGELIQGERSDEVLPIASITKLFTAYAADASRQLDEMTWINWNDIYTEGHSGKLRHGQQLSVRELLFPLLLESSNDAGTALGRVLGDAYPTEIDALRNELELTQTNVVDPTGLDPHNVSNAEELAVFFSYLKQNHTFITDITTLRMHIDGQRGLVNNDPARELRSFRGGKHGYLPEAGRTFVGSFELQSGSEIGVVLLGSDDIIGDVTAILEYAQKLAARASLL